MAPLGGILRRGPQVARGQWDEVAAFTESTAELHRAACCPVLGAIRALGGVACLPDLVARRTESEVNQQGLSNSKVVDCRCLSVPIAGDSLFGRDRQRCFGESDGIDHYLRRHGTLGCRTW